MRRSRLVLLGLLLGAVAEVSLLVVLERAIGLGPLLAVLVAEAVLGGWLVRREGARAWASLRDAQRDPEQMGASLSDAGLVLAGAILLMLPGLLSDAVGALFLLPATRPLTRRGTVGLFRALTRRYRDQADLLAARIDRSSVVEGAVADTPTPSPDPPVIKGEVEP